MEPSWTPVYSEIATAVINLDSVDSLLKQAVRAIATTYAIDCLLWTRLDLEAAATWQVYGTASACERFQVTSDLNPSPPEAPESPDDAAKPQAWVAQSLPSWLLTPSEPTTPQPLQLETGDWIFPILKGDRLQFVLQVASPSAGFLGSELTAITDALQVVCTQLALATQALYWRQRLEQFRQQAALGGRIVHLLNSNLNPDEIVKYILAELGQGLESDRCILVDLRDNPIKVLAAWDNPDCNKPSLENLQLEQNHWQNVIDMFLQWAVSHIDSEMLEQEADPLQDWLQEMGVVSTLIVPLFIQSEFFGALLFLSCRQPKEFNLDELQMIRQATDQVAIALTNAQHYQGLWHQQESLRIQSNALQLEMIQDKLTQSLNKYSLERELEELSTPARWAVQAPFSLMVFDLDYFKLVNDNYGFSVGDEILKEVAQRLQKQLRQGTFVYRYGGEEFAIILSEVGLNKAMDVAERLRSVVRSQLFITSTGPLNITVSCGVAQQDPTQDQTAWDVMKRAEAALDQAKRQGRDCVVGL